MLRVATIVDSTEAEGPGNRLALWVQGCTIRCPGCCNPELFTKRGGTDTAIEDLLARFDRASRSRGDRAGDNEGVSILGGEPFEQAAGVAAFARGIRERGKTVMVYSGYRLAELHEQAASNPAITELLAAIDLLVDGRYDRDLPEPPPPIGRRWLGSTNQVMHFLTPAYSADDPRMRGSNTVEIHWRDGKLVVNGWPLGADTLVRRTK